MLHPLYCTEVLNSYSCNGFFCQPCLGGIFAVPESFVLCWGCRWCLSLSWLNSTSKTFPWISVCSLSCSGLGACCAGSLLCWSFVLSELLVSPFKRGLGGAGGAGKGIAAPGLLYLSGRWFRAPSLGQDYGYLMRVFNELWCLCQQTSVSNTPSSGLHTIKSSGWRAELVPRAWWG